MIPSVSANVSVGRDTTPFAHTACVSAGATGVASSQVVPVNCTVNVAVAGSTWVHPGGICIHPYPSMTVAVTVTETSADPS